MTIPINRIDVFQDGIPFEGEVDVEWFLQIPNYDVASARLEFLRTPGNISDLLKRGHGGEDIERMWKAVYRACIGFDVPLPLTAQAHARELGIVVME